MNHKKLVIGVAALALAIPAAASGETIHYTNVSFPKGYLKINPTTCRFLHPEIDVKPSVNEAYARAEDARDDVLFACLRTKIDTVKLPAPDTCWTTPPVVVEAPADRQGYHDTRGAAALYQWAATLAACEQARNGGNH